MKAAEREALLATLAARFGKNRHLHPDIAWSDVLARLNGNVAAIHSLAQMESTGGEPDVVGFDKPSGQYTFCDCCAESPAGRRSLCYDREALESRRENRPANSAVEMANAMGVRLLTEDQYRALQKHQAFDLKTSSWIQTPANIRELGGALFCDRRYDTVFVYHNGAQSYYAARGFRGSLQV